MRVVITCRLHQRPNGRDSSAAACYLGFATIVQVKMVPMITHSSDDGAVELSTRVRDVTMFEAFWIQPLALEGRSSCHAVIFQVKLMLLQLLNCARSHSANLNNCSNNPDPRRDENHAVRDVNTLSSAEGVFDADFLQISVLCAMGAYSRDCQPS